MFRRSVQAAAMAAASRVLLCSNSGINTSWSDSTAESNQPPKIKVLAASGPKAAASPRKESSKADSATPYSTLEGSGSGNADAEDEEDDDAPLDPEKENCPFCRSFLASPCATQFRRWSRCVDRCKKDDSDFVKVCEAQTKALLDCTGEHKEYFKALEPPPGHEEGEGDDVESEDGDEEEEEEQEEEPEVSPPSTK